jgi:hypothetical protein
VFWSVYSFMNSDTIRLQLRGIDDGILTTERSIRRLEDVVRILSETDEDRLEEERQLRRLREVLRSFDEIRADLIRKLQGSVDMQNRMPECGAVSC